MLENGKSVQLSCHAFNTFLMSYIVILIFDKGFVAIKLILLRKWLEIQYVLVCNTNNADTFMLLIQCKFETIFDKYIYRVSAMQYVSENVL